MIIHKVKFSAVFKALGLKEHTLYKAQVKCSEHNVEHLAFLFVGFENGAYTKIYINNYDGPIQIYDVYSITDLQELYSLKPFQDPPQIEGSTIDEAMEGAPFDTDEELFPKDVTGLMEDPEDILP